MVPVLPASGMLQIDLRRSLVKHVEGELHVNLDSNAIAPTAAVSLQRAN